MKHAVKLVKETPDAYLVGGYGVVWGGRDLEGQHFEKDTDFWFDRVTETPPVLYQHGMDGATGKSVLGQVSTKTMDDTGLWIEAQIAKSNEYADVVMELVKRGVLGWSSGSVTHLAAVEKTGKITCWPVVEFSLTPTPAEPRTLGVAELDALSASATSIKSIIDKVKALPAGNTPMQGDDGDPPEGSYEDLIADLNRLLRIRFQVDPYSYGWCYTAATFPDYCVVCVYDGDDTDYYRVAYVLGADGDPVLGDIEAVEPVYQPIALPPADTEITAIMADYTTRSARSLATRLRGLHEGRVKEGRVLSSSNRKRLQTARDAMDALLKDFEDLLTATEPKTTEEAGTAKAVVEVQAAYARILALATGLEVPA